MNLLFVSAAVLAGTWLAQRERNSAVPDRIAALNSLESELSVVRQRSEELRERSIDSVESMKCVIYDIYMARRAMLDTPLEQAP